MSKIPDNYAKLLKPIFSGCHACMAAEKSAKMAIVAATYLESNITNVQVTFFQQSFCLKDFQIVNVGSWCLSKDPFPVSEHIAMTEAKFS